MNDLFRYTSFPDEPAEFDNAVQECESLRQKLAASEQREAKLRAVLEIYAADDVWWQETPTKYVWNLDSFPYDDARIALGMIEAQPQKTGNDLQSEVTEIEKARSAQIWWRTP